jgi:hypothetical protein
MVITIPYLKKLVMSNIREQFRKKGYAISEKEEMLLAEIERLSKEVERLQAKKQDKQMVYKR